MTFKAQPRSFADSPPSIWTKLRLGSDLVTNIWIFPLAWLFAVHDYIKARLGVIVFSVACCLSGAVGMTLRRNTARRWRLTRSRPACTDRSAKLICAQESWQKQIPNFA